MPAKIAGPGGWVMLFWSAKPGVETALVVVTIVSFLFAVPPLPSWLERVSRIAAFTSSRGRARIGEADARSLRQHQGIIELEGTVDVLPAESSMALANHLRYTPRPVIQSFCAFTPALAQKNAAFLLGDKAPEHILFRVAGVDSTVDNRYPAFADSLGWIPLIFRYQPAGVMHGFLHLRRSANPLTPKRVLIKDTVLQFGEELVLPVDSEALYWAEIVVRKNLGGSLLNLAYRLPALQMTIRLPKEERQFRFIPGIAESGFLLSPMVHDNPSFSSLYENSPYPVSQAVQGLRIDASARARLMYVPQIRAQVYRYDPPHR
jgi:hypothetical protein